MDDWDSRQYLKFLEERTQPARDLAAAVGTAPVKAALDAGCGPGNSTAVLAGRFPGASITGADTSEDMLAAARRALPEARFLACDLAGDLSALGGGYDLVFSNACLQWVPRHETLVPRLFALLREGGTLAVQMPVQGSEPIHAIIGEVSHAAPWSGYIAEDRLFHTLDERRYYGVLSALTTVFRLWKTTYFHVLSSHQDILEWYRGTGLRPYLAQLPEDLRPAFEAEILCRVRTAYPALPDGHVLFPFPRLFFTAQKQDAHRNE